MSGGITVAYSGVHAAYQIALAAYEMSALDEFRCSLFDSPGTWGGLFSRLAGPDALVNRRCRAIPRRLVREDPWPLLLHRARARWEPRSRNDWFAANSWFDRRVAKKLTSSNSRIFVGGETCSEHSFQVAKTLGMSTVLDCEQVHPDFLWALLAQAADDLGVPLPPPVDPPSMAARKRREYAMADTILVLSEVERRSFLEQGFDTARLVEIPLWVDPQQWFPPPTPPTPDAGPLRVLFVGGIDLRKGIPYLLRAARACGPAVSLSLVGIRDPQLEPILRQHVANFQYVPPKTKSELRQIYQRSDVLVLPSLVDTFGFVAVEAMACGIPVIVSENCGAPVPDSSWRVPIMDTDAIMERLLLYAGDRELCREHGRLAAPFAGQLVPENYRRKVQAFFGLLLGRPWNPPAASLPCV